MNRQMFAMLALTELRLRARRTSSLVALAAMLGLAWLVIAAPVDDTTLLVLKDARVLNTSAALALSSAAELGSLLVLFGFFLLRGRAGDDIRSGLGGVIAASPVSNTLFLLTRSVAGMAYLSGLVLAFMASTLLFQVTQGVGPVELGVYLQSYALVLLPTLVFTASCATLFDSVSVLMGKAGDLIYFFIWAGLLGLLASVDKSGGQAVSYWTLLDFSGALTSVIQLSVQLGSTDFNLGLSSFDPKLAPVTMQQLPWSTSLLLMRSLTLALALTPLLLATLCFHRYSPDRVKVSAAAARRSPLAVINTLLRPLSRLAQPLFRLAAWLPGMAGQVLADTALTLASSPLSMALLLLSLAAAIALPPQLLGGLLIPVSVFWGVLISDLSSRDFQANTEFLSGTMPGGAARRHLRQLAAACLLGLLFMGLIALRWAAAGEWLRCLALISGVLSMSALASLLGVLTGNPRCFLGFYLGGLYIALNARDLAPADAFGFNGSANAFSIGGYLVVAAVTGLTAYAWQVRRAR
ncbi:hypothetical protein [Roseateles oligotrophus]|uniref:ABC-2 type transport system permease protein n=1 Tax=Roseateles oligotrophus TaxID=1769250 RepID=A0ABT2YMY5_9BURK|nr:hypothetical protein [Roseateles oligotrophus]MCV2371281.1 hypothetical protein [Roseateles oligotrophus]